MLFFFLLIIYRWLIHGYNFEKKKPDKKKKKKKSADSDEEESEWKLFRIASGFSPSKIISKAVSPSKAMYDLVLDEEQAGSTSYRW